MEGSDWHKTVWSVRVGGLCCDGVESVCGPWEMIDVIGGSSSVKHWRPTSLINHTYVNLTTAAHH